MDLIISKLLNNEELTKEEWEQIEDLSVSNAMLRVNLINAGLYDTVNNYIINGTDEKIKILWEYSSYIDVNNKIVLNIAQQLNISYSQLKELFRE